MNLPKRVKIGFREYAVKLLGKDFSDAGQHCAETRVIRVRKIAPREDANTLIHEILHAAWKYGELGNNDIEERCVTVLANVLTEVIADNPHVMAYLTDALTEKEGH